MQIYVCLDLSQVANHTVNNVRHMEEEVLTWISSEILAVAREAVLPSDG